MTSTPLLTLTTCLTVISLAQDYNPIASSPISLFETISGNFTGSRFDGSRPNASAASPSPVRTPKASKENTGAIRIRIFDGSRQPLAPGTQVLVRVIDGNQREIISRFFRGSDILFKDLPLYDNFGDNYRVIVSADRYKQAGFTPVRINPEKVQIVDLMLIPKRNRFDFTQASWDSLRQTSPQLWNLLAEGVSEDTARQRYERLMTSRPAVLACLLNIAAALSAVDLRQGSALSYLNFIIWDDSMKQDRFYAYAPMTFLTDVKQAAKEGKFARDYAEKIFHPGAITSYKQIQFGEANVQLTFHHAHTRIIRDVEYIEVEIDIDYYKDLLAHLLLEVVPNLARHGLTDPRVAYQLRWIAGRRAGVPEFDPHYTIVGR